MDNMTIRNSVVKRDKIARIKELLKDVRTDEPSESEINNLILKTRISDLRDQIMDTIKLIQEINNIVNS